MRGLVIMLLASLLLVPLSADAASPLPPALDQHGRSHDLNPPFDEPVLLDFAASWCGPCRVSLPRVEALAERYPGLRILVISVDSSPEGRDNLVRSLDLKLPVVWDEDYRLAETWEPPAMPSSFLLDRDGRVVYAAAGSSEKEWQATVAAVKQLLASYSP